MRDKYVGFTAVLPPKKRVRILKEIPCILPVHVEPGYEVVISVKTRLPKPRKKKS